MFNILLSNQVDSEYRLHVVKLIDTVLSIAVLKSVAILQIFMLLPLFILARVEL